MQILKHAVDPVQMSEVKGASRSLKVVSLRSYAVQLENVLDRGEPQILVGVPESGQLHWVMLTTIVKEFSTCNTAFPVRKTIWVWSPQCVIFEMDLV